MADAEKQKKQKAPGRKATGMMARRTIKAGQHANVAVEQFMSGEHPELQVAKVVKVHGNEFELARAGAPIGRARVGALRISRKASRNPAIATAIGVGDYVLVDGGRIRAKLTLDQVRQAKAVNRGAFSGKSRSGSRSANSLFERANYRPKGVEAELAGRKAEHKRPPSRSSTASSRSSASSHHNRGYYLSEVKIQREKKQPKFGFNRPVIDPSHPDYSAAK